MATFYWLIIPGRRTCFLERMSDMGKILRINNLSTDTTAEDLRTLFGGVGAIAGAKISRQKETGISKGYGFVKMETRDAARSAINALNGRTLKGQEIRVVAVRPPSGSRKSSGRSRPPKAL
jgi:RNA recognition motif-containing protein